MKAQDILFCIVLLSLFLFRRPKLFVYAGLGCFMLAIPLFARWVFFTAERLTWYGAAFIFVYLLIFFFSRDTIK